MKHPVESDEMRLLSVVIVVLCVVYSIDAAVSRALNAVNPGNDTLINHIFIVCMTLGPCKNN